MFDGRMGEVTVTKTDDLFEEWLSGDLFAGDLAGFQAWLGWGRMVAEDRGNSQGTEVRSHWKRHKGEDTPGPRLPNVNRRLVS